MLKIGFVGLGLIGGSLAKAIKRVNKDVFIVATNRNEDVLKAAKSEGVICDYTLDDFSLFLDCDYIFICTPVTEIVNYIKKLVPYVDKKCIITDVGSTKLSLVKEIEPIDITFVGGHPMTGSEQTRYTSSKAHLFENAYYILTPTKNCNDNDVKKLVALAESLGAIPIVMEPSEHDAVMGFISHMPHVIASLVVNAVRENDSKKEYMFRLAAGGFKDITRIASSSPYMWQSICKENKSEILSALNSIKQSIDTFISNLNEDKYDDILCFFSNAKEYRDSFVNKSAGGYMRTFQIYVDVLDKPGAIARVSTILYENNINIKNISIVNSRENVGGAMEISFDSPAFLEKALKLLKENGFHAEINK